ncbi:L,D-transpeptidase family protein [Sphingomonas sp.]|uniref:L,D-transpeptidase family protein n=1 Tax=Sphingomonas sp. TaxID=28214 RepID=UPI0025D52F5E|nr:L,D-transpeptidase family protein [Sphingomonas sp.]MBV9529122.1 L,D-transpeptidase family protein [Sphingomonas sp.]
MKSLRNARAGLVPVRVMKGMSGAVAALTIAAAPLSSASATPAAAAPLSAAAVTAARPSSAPASVAPLNIYDFYRTRAGAPLWLSSTAGDSAQQLIGLLKSADLDGLNPDRYGVAALETAVADSHSADPKAVQRADVMLSQAFVAYVDDLRQDPGVGVTYVDAPLRPAPPSAMTLLSEAASAASLADYVRSMGWMHPIYGQLRAALAAHRYADDHERGMLQVNLERARVLPATKQKYVLVNAAQQRLYMYDRGQPVDSMVVVVGKPKWPTPMLTAYIRFAALNPYWYVPPDLAGEDVGQFVVKQGLGYLDKMGYEVVSDWNDNPTIIDPKTIDWKGVVAGKVNVLIRQKPGPQNFMGRMKFMFPNQFGVYLHDNPRRDLFLQSVRYYSGGCVRLEDASRLGRWLFGRDLDWQSAGVEQPVMLAQPVPVYITYMTAMPDNGAIAYYKDVYGRDGPQLATQSANGAAAAVGH